MTQNVKKATEFALDTDQEVADLLTFISNLDCQFLEIVPNKMGSIVRLNQSSVKVEDVLAELRDRCLEPETTDSLPDDTNKTLEDTCDGIKGNDSEVHFPETATFTD